jgi:pimeloyl-ACP methyl ester carboxylesterase
MLEDSYYMGLGNKLVHASQVYCRVMIINPEYDTWCRDEDVEALKRDLVHSPEIKVWAPRNATHYILLDRPEHGRIELMAELAKFIDRPA